MNWRLKGACVGADTEIFFSNRAKSRLKARAICARCPVIGQCREFVDRMEDGDSGHWGVWGNSTPEERAS